ncbi:MAG TPA: hypothetical protein VEB22_13790, partial [Phycisphaerales bacterium]|nr:hypothetical protein [Phycisphaerales bacterium]
KYGPKVRVLQERLRKAEQRVEAQKEQASEATFGTVLSVGAAVLGGLFGRGKAGTVSKAASAARGAGRTVREKGDVSRAEEDVESVRAQMEKLKADFDKEVAELSAGAEEVETVVVRAKKSGVHVEGVWLAWAPYWVDAAGNATEAWR